MAVGMGMTMAPATESVMGSLPREKAGVGSAVNDTTRQMGGALGVAIIGSVVSSVYAANISDIAGRFGVRGAALTESRASLGGALGVADGLGDRAAGYTVAVKDGFVDALSNGLRISALVILGAAFVAWRFLPARARDPLAVEAHDEAPAPGRTRPPARPWRSTDVDVRADAQPHRPGAVRGAAGRAGPMPTRRSSGRPSSCSRSSASPGCRWTSSLSAPASARRPSTGAGTPRRPSSCTPCG